jgi:DNA-binding MarR family transcriptional regulator
MSAARGHHARAEKDRHANGEAHLSLVVGPARARILAAVDSASTTAKVAAFLGIAPSTASAHLVSLHRAGILTRTRSGRTVHYALSPIGNSLLELFGEPEATADEDR